jgi:hypothetical protein
VQGIVFFEKMGGWEIQQYQSIVLINPREKKSKLGREDGLSQYLNRRSSRLQDRSISEDWYNGWTDSCISHPAEEETQLET